MKIIPILRVIDMKESVFFYTSILDFELKYPDEGIDPWVTDLINGEAEIQLTSVEGNQKSGFAINVQVKQIDNLFQRYLQRGLDTSKKLESPVHQGPLDQSWGTREFYVNDPNGNTLRFQELTGTDIEA